MNYPYLPEGRKIELVGLDNSFLQEAKKECELHSTDLVQPTGAVVVKDGAIIGRDANKSAFKSRFLIRLHKEYLCVRRLLKIKSGTKYWICPGCATHKQHAESSSVTNARKNGKDTAGADVYLWGHWWCCKPCWDVMLDGGIKNVYLYSDSIKLFKR